VDELIAGNLEHLAMVRKLEESVDASEATRSVSTSCLQARRSPPSSNASSAARSNRAGLGPA